MEEKKRIIKMADIIPLNKEKDKRRKNVTEKVKEEIEDRTNKNEADFFEEVNNLKKNKNRKEMRIKNRKKKSGKKNKKTLLLIYTGIIALFVVTIYSAIFIMPKVTIIIDEHKQSWEYDGIVKVLTGINSIDITRMSIPGEIFKQDKNIVMSFKASGEKYVERKATGKITIYNNYSSSPQPLVKRTRFMTPDGKIYRIIKNVTIPGAKVVKGKIQPSSITVDVIADKAGEKYNIGPVKKFTIPGFEGSDKFYGFYGKSSESMVGGVIGKIPYPTDKDIQEAKDKVAKKLTDALNISLNSQIPDGLVVLDDAKEIAIKNLNINKITNKNGEFNVIGEGTISVIVFKGSDIHDLLRKKGLSELGLSDSFIEKEKNIKYLKPDVDWNNEKIKLPVKYNAIFWSPADKQKIKKISKGKNAIELKTAVLSLPNIDKLMVSFWPFWVGSAPNKESRIFVKIK